MVTVLIIVLIVVLLGGGAWGYRSGEWGAPGGLIALVVIIILILWATGNLGNLSVR